MALPIRDGNQSLTTLSTIVVSSAHIPAHTVISLGSQAITDIAQAVSGVELGPNSISALEHISVTISAGTSITVGNVVSVTGGLTNAELRASSVTVAGVVTANINGTVPVSGTFWQATQPISVSSLPASTVTVSSIPSISGSVTLGVGTQQIGSVTVSNFPATQTVTFTQASVTFGQAVVSASNIGDLLSSVGTDNTADPTTKFLKIGGHQDGQNQTSHIVHVSSGGAMKVDATDSTVTFGAINGTVTVGNSVTISNFPATQAVTFTQASVTFGTAVITGSTSIIGTASVTFGQASVTFGATTGSVSVLNFPSTQTIAGTVTVGGFSSVSVGNNSLLVGGSRGGVITPIPLDNGSGKLSSIANIQYYDAPSYIDVSPTNPLPIRGTVTVGNSVTIGSLPAISGTVTANVLGRNANYTGGVTALQLPIIGYDETIETADAGVVVPVQITNTLGVVGGSNALPISGAVTANAVIYNVEEGYDEAINQNVLAVHVKDLSGNVLGSSGSPLPISGTVTANGGDFAGTNGTTPPAKVVPIGYIDTIGTGNLQQVGTDSGEGLPTRIKETYIDGVGYRNLPTWMDGSSFFDVPISGTVTANNLSQDIYDAANDWRLTRSALHLSIGSGEWQEVGGSNGSENPLPIAGTVTVGSLPDGVSFGQQLAEGYDNYGGAPVQIVSSSITQSISGTVTASSVQGTSVTTSNFTSTTANTTLVSANASRRGLTVFNEGAGNLHICAGATATTIAYQVRLSAGDYWECPAIQTSLTHSAQFASVGTARIVEIL